MTAYTLNEIVAQNEDGMGQCPDWRNSQAFFDALFMFIKNESCKSSAGRKTKAKDSEDKILTVDDVLNSKRAG